MNKYIRILLCVLCAFVVNLSLPAADEPASAKGEPARGISVVANDKSGARSEVKLYRQTHAVIIGIDKYPHLPPDRQLAYAVKDARAVAETVSKLYVFNTLITLYNEQATRNKILETFNKLSDTSTEDDAVFVFFAGHGYTEKTRHGELGYLIPSDGSLDKLHLNISMTTIREDISKKIPAKHIFYVIDACYSGLLLRGEPKKAQRNLEYLQEITREYVRQVLTAGDKDQTVLDGGPKGHSVFTGRFIEALEEATDFITAREISQSVKEKVFSDARTRNHTQTPKDGELFGLGDFVFVPNKDRMDDLLKSKTERLSMLARAETELSAKAQAEQAETKAREQKISELDRQIAELQKKLGAAGRGDSSTLDQILALVRQKEQQANELAEMRKKAEQERKEREAEIAHLKQAEQQKQLETLQADIAKYQEVADSQYGKDLKDQAWNALLEKWGLPKGGVPAGNISTLYKALNPLIGTGWSAIAAGSTHTVALKTDGSLYAWGANDSGQLGDGTTTDRLTPTLIGTGFSAIAAGGGHTIALKTDGTLYAWGWNDYDQLGDGTTITRTTPTLIGTGWAGAALYAGAWHTIALKTDPAGAGLYAWGRNYSGQLGDGTQTSRYTPTRIGTGWSAIAAGGWHTIALKQDGTLHTWGANDSGQLGDGTTTDRWTPTLIGTGFSAIAAGEFHTIALKTDPAGAGLYTWGRNGWGQLGDGTTGNKSTPTRIGTGWSAIAAGGLHTIALKTDPAGAGLYAWGYNKRGQLGDGTTTSKNTPTLIGADTDWSAIAAGYWHTVALKSDGTLYAWGRNDLGQLGDGTTTDRWTPTLVGQ